MQIEAPADENLGSPHVTCAVLKTADSFFAIEAEYRSLFARSPRSSIYQSWEWIRRWWVQFGGAGTRLHVLTFRGDGELIGCAPLVMRLPGRLPLRRLEAIGVLRSDYLDLVIADGQETAVLQSFVDYLEQSSEWDLLDLQQIPEDSPTLAFFRSREAVKGFRIRQQEVCPFARLPNTWNAYLAALGKKNRYNVGYYRRLLERDFKLWIGRVEKDDLRESMNELFRLHQVRWRKRHLPGAFYSANVREFHLGVAEDLLKNGQLDLYRLDLNGKAVAALYCFAQNGRGYYYLGGFDPAFARYSVGTVLTAFAIQQSISRRDAVFDFLRGNEPYKYRWNVEERFNYRVEWLRGGFRSNALYALNAATRAIETRIKMLAHSLEK